MNVIRSPFHGVVASLAANTVTVKSASKKGARSFNFTVRDGAKVIRDGKECDLKEIKPGDPVVVTFTAKPGSAVRHVTKVVVAKSGGE